MQKYVQRIKSFILRNRKIITILPQVLMDDGVNKTVDSLADIWQNWLLFYIQYG